MGCEHMLRMGGFNCSAPVHPPLPVTLPRFLHPSTSPQGAPRPSILPSAARHPGPVTPACSSSAAPPCPRMLDCALP